MAKMHMNAIITFDTLIFNEFFVEAADVGVVVFVVEAADVGVVVFVVDIDVFLVDVVALFASTFELKKP